MSNPKNYLIVSAIVFALVALAHLLRAVNSWPLVFGDWPVPVALSWGAAIVTAVLSAWSLSLLRGRA
jgi:hypothetical protein